MEVFEFGPFRLDTAERLILLDGRPVPVAPRVFDTLVALLENAGRLVEKNELISMLWPDTFVEEGTLARYVSDLRKVLGESSGKGKYIETVPKAGYRFVATVTRSDRQDAAVTIERRTTSRVVVEEESEGDVRSIAVLPFKLLGADMADEHLALGLADALITRLSNIRHFAVRPTGAVLKYSGRDHDPMSAARELRVEAVLDGAIQRCGVRVRVTAQLVRAGDQRSLWADTFDEMFTDLFSVEDSISGQIAKALMLRLTQEERLLLARRYTENSAAYELYLRGRYHWNRRKVEGLERSIACFLRAIEIDPRYALAYAGLADSYTLLGDVGFAAIQPKQAFSNGKQAAVKALDIDGSLAEARASLGHIHMHCYEWEDARDEFQRAIELNPNYSHSRQLRAFYFAFRGLIREAREEIRRALSLDPISLPMNTDVGVIDYFARDYARAIDQYRQTLEMDSNFDRAHFWLAAACEQQGMYAEAIEEYTAAFALSGGTVEARASLGHAYARAGQKDAALRILEEISEEAPDSYVSPYDMAIVSLGLGEIDTALKWLDRGCDEHAGWMIYLTVDPRLDVIRSHPRFVDVLRRVGFRSNHA